MEWCQVVESKWFWTSVLVFRLWNALFVRTVFNPDEFWQSTEVAHHLVFNYGHLTWEWQSDAQIRGFAHPAVFALLYKALEILGMDSRWAIAYGPRLLQGFFAASTDYFVYRLANNYLDRNVAKWAVFCQLFSWFLFYAMVRPFSNSIETLCTAAALSYWPWTPVASVKHKKDDDATEEENSYRTNTRVYALIWAAFGVLFRPSNAVIWICLGLFHLIQARDKLRFLLEVAVIGLLTTASMLCIDRVGYGEWTFVPYNFAKFNILEGKDALYGEQPWSWYITQGFPAVTGSMLPLSLVGYLSSLQAKRELGYLLIWSLGIFSLSTHKEFRFIMPLVPIAVVYAAFCLRNLEQRLYIQLREHTQKNLLRVAVFLIAVPSLHTAVYLSRYHQRAPLEVMDHLAARLEEHPHASIHFWTPCHATPYYSHLHRNVPMWFPDCSPDNRLLPEGSESHQLETSPIDFLKLKYDLQSNDTPSLPDYVVMYSSLATSISDVLDRLHYTEDASFFHSHVSGDAERDEGFDRMLVFVLDGKKVETNDQD